MSGDGRLTQERLRELRRAAIAVRRHLIDAVHHAGAGHLGGPLSAADILVALYFELLRIDPQDPQDPQRDRFILSKGHSSIGLYATLAMRGYFAVEELRTFDRLDSRLQGHPDMTVLPGIDMSSGSLGQGLSPGIGMALAARLQGHDYHTWVLLGDGDSQEGQIWEAAAVASRYRLGNLTAILDWNGLQQYGWATDSGYTDLARQPAQENPVERWRSFGWATIEIDGHDLNEIVDAGHRARATEAPTIVVARTTKGRGISFMENDFNWHAKPPSDEELQAALGELAAQEEAL